MYIESLSELLPDGKRKIALTRLDLMPCRFELKAFAFWSGRRWKL